MQGTNKVVVLKDHPTDNTDAGLGFITHLVSDLLFLPASLVTNDIFLCNHTLFGGIILVEIEKWWSGKNFRIELFCKGKTEKYWTC